MLQCIFLDLGIYIFTNLKAYLFSKVTLLRSCQQFRKNK